MIAGITPKRVILTVLGVGWLVLVASDYGVLTGRKSMYYPGKFTTSGQDFETVRCGYWIGFGARYVKMAGPPGSMSGPWTLHLENKWNTKEVVSDSPTAIVSSDH